MEMNGRVVFRVVFLVGFCWFLLFAISVSSVASFGSSSKSHGKTSQDGWALNYVSKRRVPNGPDPIHNRRTGNTRQPPDRT